MIDIGHDIAATAQAIARTIGRNIPDLTVLQWLGVAWLVFLVVFLLAWWQEMRRELTPDEIRAMERDAHGYDPYFGRLSDTDDRP
jgi:preprotein translocase subunit SecY